MRPLSTTASVLVCSPHLFGRRPRPRHPTDLADLPTLDMGSATDRYTWEFQTPDGEEVSVAHAPRLLTDDFATLRQAAIGGVGIAMLPYFMVRDGLANGVLEQLLPEFGSPESLVHAVFPSRRGLVPAVRALLDALLAGFERPPGPGRANIASRTGSQQHHEPQGHPHHPRRRPPDPRRRRAAGAIAHRRQAAWLRQAAPAPMPRSPSGGRTRPSSPGATCRRRGAASWCACSARSCAAQGRARPPGHDRDRQDPVQEGLGEVQEMIDICDFAVGLSRQLYGLTIASERPGHRMMETWHPLGVVGVITRVQLPGRGVVVERRARARVRRQRGVEAVREDAADRARLPGPARPGAGALRRSHPDGAPRACSRC